MSIRDDLQAIKPKPRTFHAWFAQLDVDDREALTEAALEGVPLAAIVNVVKMHDGHASRETIAAWRLTLGRNR